MSEVYESVENLFSGVYTIQLLAKVNEILAKFKKNYEDTGERFNIFEILKVETKELKICDLLYELLNPSGSHNKGKLFLELFVKNVLRLKIHLDELQNSVVYREYSTFNGRRIDLVITTSKHFIPIEVKIYAEDSYAQCRDYFEEAKRHSAAKMFYLTPDGREPSEISTKGMSEDDKKNIECRSFKEDILLWLNSCLNQPDVQKTPPIYCVLKQFSSIFKQNKMEETMEIAKLIRESPESMEAAFEVARSWDEELRKLKRSIFEDVENILQDILRENHNIYNMKASEEDKCVFTYYKNNNNVDKNATGITYDLEDIDSKEKSVCGVRLELWNGVFYAGKVHPYESKNSWIDYNKIYEVDEANPNFNEPNDKLFQLCDKSKLDDFVQQCVKKILDYAKPVEADKK